MAPGAWLSCGVPGFLPQRLLAILPHRRESSTGASTRAGGPAGAGGAELGTPDEPGAPGAGAERGRHATPAAGASWWRAATGVDVAWSAFVALLLALSPLTGAKRLLPSIVLGAAGGALVLGARLRRRAREGEPARGAAIARPHAVVAGVVVAAIALFAPTATWLYDQYTESIWRNPHGLFVPFFALLLVRHRLREDPDPRPRSSAWGLVLLALACALVIADAGIRSQYLALAGLLVALPGLSLLLLGARRTWRLAFPLALCAFLVPLPQGLADPLFLPTLSAEVGQTLAEMTGLPVARFGTRLDLPNGLSIEVSQNCSGLSFFYGGCALAALCFGVSRSWPRRVVLVAAPYLLTALGNGVRIAFLLLAAQRVGLDWKYNTPIHGLIGTGVFLSVMAGIWLLSDRRALREALS